MITKRICKLENCYYDNNNNEYVITLRVAKMYIPLIRISSMATYVPSIWQFGSIIFAAIMQDRFAFQYLVRLF